MLYVEQPERLSRLNLFIKWIAFVPLYLWLLVYGFAALVLGLFSFVAIIFTRAYPLGFFSFIRGYLQLQARAWAYFPLLLTDRWSQREPHPVRLEIRPPDSLSRWNLLLLKLPSFLLSIGFNLAAFGLGIALLAAIPAWFWILVRGRYPAPLFRLVVRLTQWSTRVSAWQYMMSDDWSLIGETRKVLALAALGALFSATVTTAVFLNIVSGGSLTERLGSAFGVDDAKAVVNEFMHAGQRGDADAAMALTTEEVSHQEIVALFSRRDLFESYEGTKVQTWFIRYGSSLGTTMELTGEFRYSTGNKEPFRAILVKPGDNWRIRTLYFVNP